MGFLIFLLALPYIIVGLLLYALGKGIMKYMKNAEEQREAKRQALPEVQLAKMKEQFDVALCKIRELETSFTHSIPSIFPVKAPLPILRSSQSSSAPRKQDQNKLLDEALDQVSLIRQLNNEIHELDPRINLEQQCKAAEDAVSSLVNGIQEFNAVIRKAEEFPPSVLMDETSYGKVNQDFLNSVRNMDPQAAVKTIQQYTDWVGNIKKMAGIDLTEIMRCMWVLAMDPSASQIDQQNAESLFRGIHRADHLDLTLMDLYQKYQLGKENALNTALHRASRLYRTREENLTIASFMMWMGAYHTEHELLQELLASGYDLPPKARQRLHALASNGGKAPAGFDVVTTEDILYFDVSSLAWKDEEYTGFFEGLAFRDKHLTYSLAVRDEVKELLLAQNIRFPNGSALLNKLKDEFEAEYGSDVLVKEVTAAAVSGNGEERSSGILAVPGEQPQLGILMLTAKIGKKLVIKFYTLYIPKGTDPAAQKQHTMTLLKKLSLSVSMWESSLRDTMLMATERLLNALVHTAPQDTAQTFAPASDGPVF